MSDAAPALDLGLVHRLTQRARRPGVSRPQQSTDLVDRHLSLARPSALVERLSGRGPRRG